MKKSRPFVGQQRILKKFLLFPKSNLGVFRWLEYAEWQEIYCLIMLENSVMRDWVFDKWIDIEDSDVPEYNDDASNEYTIR